MTARILCLGRRLHWRLLLAFGMALTVFLLQSNDSVFSRCPDACPVVSLVSVEPSPVREGENLTATVRIDQPIQQGMNPVTGGILIFDSADLECVESGCATSLVAFVFRGGSGDSDSFLRGQRLQLRIVQRDDTDRN